jgi:ADP-heptose:LPS heptosyltransferase
MQNSRYVDEVMNFDKSLGPGSIVAFIGKLRRKRFDLAIVASTVSTSFTSDLFAFLSNASIRIGPASLDGNDNPSSFFFNVPVRLDWRVEPHRHQTLRNLDILSPLKIVSDDLTLDMTFYDEETAMIDRMREEKSARKKLVIGYHPGAGKIPNRWEPERFASVANTLAQELAATALITAGPMDNEAVLQMTQRLTIPYSLIKGKTIREVASILTTVDLMITNDTGIMHVAGAVGVPVLSLFGPTDPEQWAPIGKRNRWLAGNGGDINNISIDDVLRSAREMLQKG